MPGALRPEQPQRTYRKDRVSETETGSVLSESPVARRYRILVVEDNRADLYLIREAIAYSKIESDLFVAPDGESAVEFIRAADSGDNKGAVHDLILLDLNLPGRSGAEVLKEIRRSAKCAATPVLIVSSSDHVRDLEETARFGASGYFRKPGSYSGFMKLGAAVLDLLCRN